MLLRTDVFPLKKRLYAHCADPGTKVFAIMIGGAAIAFTVRYFLRRIMRYGPSSDNPDDTTERITGSGGSNVTPTSQTGPA